ncbi:MAG: NADH-quinone oxidoreductase subunit NuoF [Calditrichaeota bacterium]|nr:MAG: NADH-quinone oxidoreductase subunit NuoF [Calditrichota bacterium]MBL1206228.1 NADH-quinone oxidoreductase subunit NuoF [Calditrichota bacterium]NOG46054.1 NADH-quinone oxidoreductase subunit NuoF [Calditrichota bacterium]
MHNFTPSAGRDNSLFDSIVHFSEPLKRVTQKKVNIFRREIIEKPVFYIGAGTCGLGAGADKTKKILIDYLQKNEIDADVIEVGCIGLCSAEPLVDIQIPGKTRLVYNNVTEDKIIAITEAALKGKITLENILAQHRNKNLTHWENIPFLDEHAFFRQQTRRVLKNCGINDPANINDYIANDGYKAFSKTLHTYKPEEVCEIVEQSGLRGRGGGGFLTGKKWKFALNTKADQKYMICNADEGDPGAFMDRAIIEGDPHSVLEGLAISAYAIGASKAYIYIRAEYPLAIERLIQAIDQAKNYGLLGKNILGKGFDFDIVIKKGAGAFVCGEETALIHSIEGKRGMPRPRPPFPAVKGLFGKPTVINNVETMANIAGIILNGAHWYKSIGTMDSRGTKVFALSGKVERTGLVEVAMGINIRDIIFDIGGGVENEGRFKAVQFGGPSGGCIPEQHLDIQIDYESLKTVGAMMGSGGMVVMDETTCMVDLAKYFMNFIQNESCGKCIPCREGTRQMLDVLENISSTKSDPLSRFKSVMYLPRLAEVIQETSLCGLGQSAPNPVLSTLRWFRHEYEEHIYERNCSAGVCQDMLTFAIDKIKCIGCMACARKCPNDAIIGDKKEAHFILDDKCIGCGVCKDVCRFDAVSVN